MPRDTPLVTTTGHDGRSVALTFDDGPNPPDTLRLLSDSLVPAQDVAVTA